MNINDSFPSNFLKASDLNDKKVGVVIDRVDMETLGENSKPILYFQGKEKGLVLNRTNANVIIDITGSKETTEWKGKKILLVPSKTPFKGEIVPCIRIEDPNPKPVATADDEEVPF